VRKQSRAGCGEDGFMETEMRLGSLIWQEKKKKYYKAEESYKSIPVPIWAMSYNLHGMLD
jgi:hypothetical protein